MSSLHLPPDSTPESIWAYYERAQAALWALRREVESDPDVAGPFAGMTASEFEEALDETRNELDRQVTLALVASFEAVIRLDYVDRASRRRKDTVSRRMRELHRRYEDRKKHTPIDDILDVWKDTLRVTQKVGGFKQLIRFRHWLAHGRCWPQKSGIDPDPADAWRIAHDLFADLPDFPVLPTP